MQAALFKDNEKQLEKSKEKLQNKRKKLKNSEIMESLREEFGVAPEVKYICNSIFYSFKLNFTRCPLRLEQELILLI